jgi:hypothetical protein
MNGISIEPIAPVTSSPRNSNNKNEWKSCCLTVNPSAVKYFIQVGILASLIVYSATMLIVDNRCESQRNYGSLLMVTLGVFLPQPKMN